MDVGSTSVPVLGHDVEVFLDDILYHVNIGLPGSCRFVDLVPKIRNEYWGHHLDTVGKSVLGKCRVGYNRPLCVIGVGLGALVAIEIIHCHSLLCQVLWQEVHDRNAIIGPAVSIVLATR